MFPAARLAFGLATLAAVAAVALLLLRPVFGLRRAERRARLSEQDARLAHASRVNAPGEMAAGRAHELTQPLTAILGGGLPIRINGALVGGIGVGGAPSGKNRRERARAGLTAIGGE